MQQKQILFETLEEQMAVFGTFDCHMKQMERAFDVIIQLKDSNVQIAGEKEENTQNAKKTLQALQEIYRRGELITDDIVSQMIEIQKNSQEEIGSTLQAMKDTVVITHLGQSIKCRSLGQKKLIKALQENTITICIGPAGTGKTFLAVAQAIAEYKRGEIERIIMSRPAIEAGEERLGFLPGDLAQKVDPYLRPLYDALNDILGMEQAKKYQERGIVEIAPLAYMRGRTLNHARIIIDESQNASLPTLKMALTRLGEGSKMILTGDITQIDLPRAGDSGLERCAAILRNIDDIAIVRLNNFDVVRHPLVRDIVKAFEKYDQQKKPAAKERISR